MANKEKIDYLLIDVRELEMLIAGMRDAEIYPVSFFSQSFELTHKILKDLHALEAAQIELLRKQMEEHEAILKDIPYIPSIQHRVAEPEELKDDPSEEKELPEKAEEPVAPVAEPEPLIAPVQDNVALEQPTPPVKENAAIDKQPEHTDVAEQPVSPSQPQPAPPLSDKVAPQGLSVNEILEKRKLSDFRKAFSLNDRFYFRRELFAGNEARMNQVIDYLDRLHSYEESLVYLKQELEWSLDDQAVADFVKLLEKRFA